MHENWLAERGEQFRSGIQIAALDPFQGQKERHRRSTPRRHQRPRRLSHRQARWRRPRSGASPRPARHDRSPRAHRRPPLPRSAIFCAPRTRRLTPRQKERLREAFVADEAHISVDVAYLHRASARGLPPSHTRPRPTPGRSSHPAPTSLFHPRNRSPRGEPYASGRTHSWPTSIPAEQATAPRKLSTDIIELGRRTARGYRNPTSYQLRMLLIAGGLDASTRTQL